MNRDRISKEIEQTYAKEPKTFALKLGIAFIVVLLLAWSSSTMERILPSTWSRKDRVRGKSASMVQ